MPYLAWCVYVAMSEMHETGGVWDKIKQRMTFGGIFAMVIHAIKLLSNYALDISVYIYIYMSMFIIIKIEAVW